MNENKLWEASQSAIAAEAAPSCCKSYLRHQPVIPAQAETSRNAVRPLFPNRESKRMAKVKWMRQDALQILAGLVLGFQLALHP
jgi:hypothetical protein